MAEIHTFLPNIRWNNTVHYFRILFTITNCLYFAYMYVLNFKEPPILISLYEYFIKYCVSDWVIKRLTKSNRYFKFFFFYSFIIKKHKIGPKQVTKICVRLSLNTYKAFINWYSIKFCCKLKANKRLLKWLKSKKRIIFCSTDPYLIREKSLLLCISWTKLIKSNPRH